MPPKFVTHGDCDTRPSVSRCIPSFGASPPSTSTRLYCLMTEARVCDWLAQDRTLQCGGWESRTQHLSITSPTPHHDQSGTLRSPLQVHERGTVYRQPSAQPPNHSLPSKKNLNRFFLDTQFVCDNVYTDYVKHSSNSLYRIIAINNLS